MFVNGDFWHGWRFPIWRHKLQAFWLNKIERNRLRDAKVMRRLRRLGWKVMRLWEHEVERDPVACIARIVDLLQAHNAAKRLAKQAYAQMPALRYRNRLPKP